MGIAHAIVVWWQLEMDAEGRVLLSTAPRWVSGGGEEGSAQGGDGGPLHGIGQLWRDHWKQTWAPVVQPQMSQNVCQLLHQVNTWRCGDCSLLFATRSCLAHRFHRQGRQSHWRSHTTTSASALALAATPHPSSAHALAYGIETCPPSPSRSTRGTARCAFGSWATCGRGGRRSERPFSPSSRQSKIRAAAAGPAGCRQRCW